MAVERMEGFATMYMRMPMSTSSLPISGTVEVEEQRVTLKFPFTGIEFDLPVGCKDTKADFDFKIRGARGDMRLTVTYMRELLCYAGIGRSDEDDTPILSFCYYPKHSPMSKIPKM